MIRLVLFLLVIGLALYTVARVMAVFRDDPKKLPPPGETTADEPDSTAQAKQAEESVSDADDGPSKD